MPGRTKLWYLKNLDIFSHLREEEYRMLDLHTAILETKGRYLVLPDLQRLQKLGEIA